MPSRAFITYLEMLKDVRDLTSTHYLISKGQRGKKGLGFLTRSATVMLCAAWERYNEDILIECIDLVLGTPILAVDLPKDVKKYLSERVRIHRNEIYPIELADNGWRNLWRGYASNETDGLNTPNAENLNKLFKRFLGIDEITDLWHPKSIPIINDFIRDRGEIAHNGSKARYVRLGKLRRNIDVITENVIQIDYSLSQYLKANHSIPVTWVDSYSSNLANYR